MSVFTPAARRGLFGECKKGQNTKPVPMDLCCAGSCVYSLTLILLFFFSFSFPFPFSFFFFILLSSSRVPQNKNRRQDQDRLLASRHPIRVWTSPRTSTLILSLFTSLSPFIIIHLFKDPTPPPHHCSTRIYFVNSSTASSSIIRLLIK